MKKNKLLLLTCLFAIANVCTGQNNDSSWIKLAPYFTPPAGYENKIGSYKDPLRFYDGRKVKTKKDWQRRRNEILERWHSLMGKWPPLVKHPDFTITDSIHLENFTRYRIRFNWRPDETTEGYLLIPDGDGKKPAVVCVFYEPETAIGERKPFVDFSLQLVRRGFIALSVGTQPVAKTKPYAQYYPDYEHASVQPLSMLAYLSANCFNLLADRPDVDSTRIGIEGFSYGSKWAMFSSCLYEKYACAVWIDGGIVFDNARPNVNYWDPWYLGKDSLYRQLYKDGYDLTELHALMAPRPFLVSGGSEDSLNRWIPLNSTIRVNEFLGYQHRVGMTNRKEHYPDQQANDIICAFFEHFLKQRH